jgi:hypothetical protein
MKSDDKQKQYKKIVNWRTDQKEKQVMVSSILENGAPLDHREDEEVSCHCSEGPSQLHYISLWPKISK